MVPIPIHKEKAGYVLNTLLVPLLNAAMGLAAGGYAEVEDIDGTRGQQPVDGLRRIGRPSAFVRGGLLPEGQRAFARHRDAKSRVWRISRPTLSVSTRKPSWP